MMSLFCKLLSASVVCQAGVLAAAAPASGAEVVGEPGENNAITDVPGIWVGHVQSDTAPT